MERIAMFFGGVLVALGLIGYLAPATFGTGPDGGPPAGSPTALIPAALGALLFLCGLVVALRPGARRHAMHLAALIGVLTAAGSLFPVIKRKFDFSQSAVVLGGLASAVAILFVILCIRSFVIIRLLRSANPPEGPRA